jgi:hypothetical protein
MTIRGQINMGNRTAVVTLTGPAGSGTIDSAAVRTEFLSNRRCMYVAAPPRFEDIDAIVNIPLCFAHLLLLYECGTRCQQEQRVQLVGPSTRSPTSASSCVRAIFALAFASTNDPGTARVST